MDYEEERKRLDKLDRMVRDKLSADRITVLIASMTTAMTRKESIAAAAQAEKVTNAYEVYAAEFQKLLEMDPMTLQDPVLREEDHR